MPDTEKAKPLMVELTPELREQLRAIAATDAAIFGLPAANLSATVRRLITAEFKSRVKNRKKPRPAY